MGFPLLVCVFISISMSAIYCQDTWKTHPKNSTVQTAFRILRPRPRAQKRKKEKNENQEPEIPLTSQWKDFLKQNHFQVIIDPWGADDGFGHRLQRLYSTVSGLIALNQYNFTFEGFGEVISQDAVYMRGRNFGNEKIYCHSIQEWNLNKYLFRSLREKLGENDKHSVPKTLELILQERRKNRAVRKWINSLRCEYLNFEEFHTIRKPPASANPEPECLMDLTKDPQKIPELRECKYLRFFLQWVSKTGALISPETNSRALHFFKFPDVDVVKTCRFDKHTINIAVHFRIGDKSRVNPKVRNISFQKIIDALIMKFSHPNFPDVPMAIHVFTELNNPCPPPDSEYLEELQSLNASLSHCTCSTQQSCVEAEFRNSCPMKCSPYFLVSHGIQMHLPNEEKAVNMFNLQRCGSECLSLPLIIHSGSTSMLSDFQCLLSSEILVVGCSYFSSFAGIFSKGITINQKCGGGTPMGDLQRGIDPQSSEWKIMMDQWSNQSNAFVS